MVSNLSSYENTFCGFMKKAAQGFTTYFIAKKIINRNLLDV